MEYIVSFLWICLESLSLYLTCSIFLSRKSKMQHSYILVFLFICINFFTGNFKIPLISNSILLIKSISLVSSSLIVFTLFEGFFPLKLLIIVLNYLFIGAIDTITVYSFAAVTGLSFSAIISRKLLYTMIGTIGKCVEVSVPWIIFYRKNLSFDNLADNKRLILMMVFPFLSILMMFQIFDSYKFQPDLSTSAALCCFILCISNFIVIYLITSIRRAENAEKEVSILNKSIEIQLCSIKSLEKNYRSQRAYTHEYKHQLSTISALLDSGEYKSAHNYVTQLQNAQSLRIFAVNTHHPIIDAVLNDKYSSAKENGIDINYRVSDLSDFSIGSDEIVVLLSNLLDNAIEACLKLPSNRFIDCSILLLEDQLLISVRNSSFPVEITDSKITTTKNDHTNHGYGILAVEKIITSLNGEYALNFSSGCFQFTAEIPQNHRSMAQ